MRVQAPQYKNLWRVGLHPESQRFFGIMKQLTKAQSHSAKCNRKRTAFRRIRYHINKVLKIKPEGQKTQDYVRLFWSHYNIQTDENPKEWLYNLYVSGENEFIRREDGRFYGTREWRGLRERVLGVYGCVCMKCGYEDKSNCVDHIKPRSKFKELELAFDNMQVLCTLCNLVKSNRDYTDYRSGILFRDISLTTSRV